MAKVFILCAPSGAGKTTIAKKVIESDSGIMLSISHTTRQRRPGETDGIDYYFVDEKEFFDLSKSRKFIENAKVYDNHYGTTRQWVKDTLSKGTDILLEIDCIGAQQIRRNLENSVSIFVLPPSKSELRKRLVFRDQDSDEVIKKRLNLIENEIAHISEFDYVIINHQLDEAVQQFTSILQAERLKTPMQIENINKAIK